MALLILGIVLFLGTHSIRMVAPGFRNDRIAAMGEGGWKGAYTLVSIVGLVILIFGYGQARVTVPVLYTTPFWLAHVSILLMAFAFITLAVSQLPSGRLKPVLKHPMLLAVKIWAFAHLLVNGDLASVILFGAFLAWAVWNRIAVKRRGGALPQPGPVTWDIAAIAIGLIFWALFIWQLHYWLIGIPISFSA